MRRLSRRERILLLVAAMVALVVGYGTLRLKPRLRDVERMEEVLARVEERFHGVEWPRVTASREQLEDEIRDLRMINDEARRALAAIESRFVSLARPAGIEDLRLQMSAHAAACRVRFRENVRCPVAKIREFAEAGSRAARAATPAAKLVRALTAGEPYELPVQELVLDANFCGLCKLLQGISELPGEVVVIRFEIDVQEDMARGPTPLSTRLWIVY